MTDEEWRPVVGYEGLYEVSDLGRVRAVRREVVRSDGVRQVRNPRVISQVVMKSGHRRVGLSRNGRTLGYLVHRLVADAFLDQPPPGKDLVLHRDDDPSNNLPGNLYWGDYVDNRADLFANRPPRNANREKEKCVRGHEFSESNTYLYGGHRQCRTCRKMHDQNRERSKSDG